MHKESNTSKKELEKASKKLIDPLAIDLTKSIRWIYLNHISNTLSECYPVAIIGKGKPILLLHGFDSCFMEFRRLVPYLNMNYQLIIPDLYGFGFCPRPENNKYGKDAIIFHLKQVLEELSIKEPIGIIGASMGGGIAIEFTKTYLDKVSKLLLLSPAGLANKQSPIPPPFNQLGVYFLRQKFVREKLCENSFYDPKDVGYSEKQIASIQLEVPGWGRSLAEFARLGGIAIKGPLPKKTIQVIWGKQDRILEKEIRKKSQALIGSKYEEIENCGHLPHIDQPEIVANYLRNLINE